MSCSTRPAVPDTSIGTCIYDTVGLGVAENVKRWVLPGKGLKETSLSLSHMIFNFEPLT